MISDHDHNTHVYTTHAMIFVVAFDKCTSETVDSLKDKYPNFEVGLKCILMVNPYLLVCSYMK